MEVDYLSEEELDLSEMTLIGEFKTGSQTLKVNTYPNEGDNVPHFHIKTSDNKPYSCVRIDAPDYFLHKGFNNKLNTGQIRDLCQFMRSKPRGQYGKYFQTNWEWCVVDWNASYEGNEIPEMVTMPNYMKLIGK